MIQVRERGREGERERGREGEGECGKGFNLSFKIKMHLNIFRSNFAFQALWVQHECISRWSHFDWRSRGDLQFGVVPAFFSF
jgi:hypothetical protein